MKKPFVCIITGPPGAGKSTISESLAGDIKKSVYLEVDSLREMIKNGYVGPAEYTSESKKQLALGAKNTLDLTINFLREGFNVFIEDILENKSQMRNYINRLKNYKFHIFLLLPNKSILAKRDRKREREKVVGKRALELHDIFTRKSSEKGWVILDTSTHSIKQTKKEIKNIILRTD